MQLAGGHIDELISLQRVILGLAVLPWTLAVQDSRPADIHVKIVTTSVSICSLGLIPIRVSGLQTDKYLQWVCKKILVCTMPLRTTGTEAAPGQKFKKQVPGSNIDPIVLVAWQAELIL